MNVHLLVMDQECCYETRHDFCRDQYGAMFSHSLCKPFPMSLLCSGTFCPFCIYLFISLDADQQIISSSVQLAAFYRTAAVLFCMLSMSVSTVQSRLFSAGFVFFQMSMCGYYSKGVGVFSITNPF